MKKSRKYYPIPTDLGELKFTEKEIKKGFQKTLNLWTQKFTKAHKEKLNSSNRLNYMNIFMHELQKMINNDQLFKKKLSAITNQVKQLEEEHMPIVVLTNKTKGLDAAISEYENIGLLYQPTDLRGKLKKKKLPLDKDLIEEYDDTLLKIKKKIKRHYRNTAAKWMDIQDLFPEVPEKEMKKWKRKKLKQSEIICHKLALEYDIAPSTMRNKLTEARNFVKAYEYLQKACQKNN